MKKILATLPLLLIAQFVSAQTRTTPCLCPTRVIKADGKPDEFFDLGKGRKIALSGFIKKTKKDTTGSEFVLYQCGHKNIIEEWDQENCKISQLNDTLIVTETGGLPVGKNFEVVAGPFRIYRIFFRNTTVIDSASFPADLPKYSAARIKKVLDQYSKLKVAGNYDTMLEVAHRLCWAYISGSKEAEKCLQKIKSRFGPFDGGIAEEFDEIWGRYELWKKENTPK
jgi:hypothetical protein